MSTEKAGFRTLKQIRTLLFTDVHSVQSQSVNEAVHRDRVVTEKAMEKISILMTRPMIKRFIEKIRKLPGTITGFDDMVWNLPV